MSKGNKMTSPAEHWHILSFMKHKSQQGPRGTCVLQTRKCKRRREITTCSTEAPFRRMMASVKSGLSVEKQKRVKKKHLISIKCVVTH